jgi:nucleoside-diphosphate-sugar epimerase
MKLVLTGGRGFVGAAMSQRLAHQPGLALMASADRRLPSGEAEDGRNLEDWRLLLAQADAVLHLAARAHVMREQASDPLAAYRAANTAGTLHLAEQAAAAGVRRFVFASTVKVHGESSPHGQPITEAAQPAPTDPYAISKWEAEQGLAAIGARTGMEIVIIRPPLVYGPGVKANFAALMRAVARGWPLPLGAIDNRRSLVALDNLVDFLQLCLTHPAAANQTFLVSDGEDLSTTDLLRRLGQAIGRPARLLPVPATLLTATAALAGRGAAAQRLCGNLQVDITKARTLLGWTPPVSVDEGLRRAAQGMAP